MDNIVGLHFLIDYENVNEIGLEGVEHLCSSDSLAIFYSKACANISRKIMNIILESQCEFGAFRLKKAGKNALDFYIVSRVGELIGTGYRGKIVVVSRDKGYNAMRDYWTEQGIAGERIILKPSIKSGIIASNENSICRKKIVAESAQVSIESEYAKYKEKEHIKKQMENLFANTEYADVLPKICELTEMEKKPKGLYLGSLKRFGRVDGTKIYRYIKQEGNMF